MAQTNTPETGKKKPNFLVRFWKAFASWLRSMKSELKKVVWPSPKQVANNTLVVLATMLICAVILWGFDYVAELAVTLLIGIGG